MPSLRHTGLACLLAQVLVACAPAPLAPPAGRPAPQAFHESLRESATDSLPAPAALPADGWWRVFDDRALDTAMQQALLHNPGLQQARARVAQAAAVVGLRAAESQPQLGLSVAATRQRGTLVNEAGEQGDLFRADARLRLDLDLLGSLSRSEQAARHDLQAQQALRQQAELLLQAELAQAHLAWRAAALERRAFEQVLQADRALLAIAERQQRAGLAAEPQRRAALDLLREDEVEAAGLVRHEALLSHAMAALAEQYDDPGDGPADDHNRSQGGDRGGDRDGSHDARQDRAPAAPPAGAALPALPAIPAGLPSAMLQRRPDVAAAEQAVQAARLRLGLARDAWFPRLALTASAGLASGELGQWLRAAARNAGLGLLLSLPGLDGGRLDAERAAAAASLQGATAEHRSAVVRALREVDDELATLRTLAAQAQLRRSGAELAAADADRLEAQWRRGFAGEGAAWQARREAARQQRLWLQVQARQLEATVSLVRALGGGWDTRAADTGAPAAPHGIPSTETAS